MRTISMLLAVALAACNINILFSGGGGGDDDSHTTLPPDSGTHGSGDGGIYNYDAGVYGFDAGCGGPSENGGYYSHDAGCPDGLFGSGGSACIE
jgi:hypothetical protein